MNHNSKENSSPKSASSMLRSHSAGGIVLNKRGEVLITSQRGSSWSLPKGHVHLNEDVLVAAKREIAEETGVTELVLIRPLGSYSRPRVTRQGVRKEMKKITLFLFTTTQEKLKPTDPHNPEARWVPKEKVVAYLNHAGDKAAFTQLLESGQLNKEK